MPTVRKLEPSEIATLTQRGQRVDLGPYIAELTDFAVGEWGAIELGAGERLPAIKRRYTLAAKELGKYLAYKRLRAGRLPFEVRDISAKPSVKRKVEPVVVQPKTGRSRKKA